MSDHRAKAEAALEWAEYCAGHHRQLDAGEGLVLAYRRAQSHALMAILDLLERRLPPDSDEHVDVT